MSVQVENLEKNMAKLTVEVAAEDFEKAVQAAYMKNRNKITIPGFRKGKAPRVMIEKMYGAGIFFEDAANALIQAEYPRQQKKADWISFLSRKSTLYRLKKEKPLSSQQK